MWTGFCYSAFNCRVGVSALMEWIGFAEKVIAENIFMQQ